MSALLEVRDVVRSFGGVRAVDGASLDVEAASITSLIGPNGAGKSTLFNIVSGFLRAEAGTVSLEGRRIDRLPPHRIARAGLVRTFQTARALARMTVLDNVVLAAPRQPGERLVRNVVGGRATRRREQEVRVRAHELLELVRLDGHACEPGTPCPATDARARRRARASSAPTPLRRSRSRRTAQPPP